MTRPTSSDLEGAPSQPWFSVVTPSLNQGRFIRDAIESVLAQTDLVGAVEHLVVDGGSTDGTHDVLTRYPHLTLLRDPGLGQSRAVNMGLRAASGTAIGWLNADDRYLPGVFAEVRRALADHADAGIVYGNAQEIDEAGTVTGEIRSGPFDVERMLNGINTVPQPAVFMRASLLERIGLLDERLDYVMDYELWLRASRSSRLVWVDATWAQFRKHPSSKTVSLADAFWPEKRAVARAYGGPYLSLEWRARMLNWPRKLAGSLVRRGSRRAS